VDPATGGTGRTGRQSVSDFSEQILDLVRCDLLSRRNCGHGLTALPLLWVIGIRYPVFSGSKQFWRVGASSAGDLFMPSRLVAGLQAAGSYSPESGSDLRAGNQLRHQLAKAPASPANGGDPAIGVDRGSAASALPPNIPPMAGLQAADY